MSIQRIHHGGLIGEILPVWLEQHRVRREYMRRGEAALGGDMTVEALPSWYADVTFRSKLEADWAATLDSLGIKWQYEPETITLPSGTTYIPDFWLPEIGIWLEVKGTGVPRVEKAIELGKTRACYCQGDCTCEWARGELVLIGHPPKPYDPWSDPEYADEPWRIPSRKALRRGHPVWSSAHGRPLMLGYCRNCDRASWSGFGWCRACDERLTGQAYWSGDTGLWFVNSSCRPAPSTGEAA